MASCISDFYKICKSMNICKECRGNIKLRILLAKSYNCEVDFTCPLKKEIKPIFNNNREGRRGKNCTPCKKRREEFKKMLEQKKAEQQSK